jgi:hypothetical protein
LFFDIPLIDKYIAITIINRTISYISSNYLAKNIPTDNLLVIVGWSSPERNSFWYKDEKTSYRFRLWPQVPLFETEQQKQFWELYVSYFWNSEEYMTRYVMNVLQLQNFCDSNGIKWMCFNSFYQTPTKDISEWNATALDDVSKELTKDGIYNFGRSLSVAQTIASSSLTSPPDPQSPPSLPLPEVASYFSPQFD